MRFAVRVMDSVNSSFDHISYQYRYVNADSPESARICLGDCMYELFPEISRKDMITLDFKPVGKIHWRPIFRRLLPNPSKYPISIEELRENEARSLFPKMNEKYVMRGWLTEGDGESAYSTYRFFHAISLKDAIRIARRTYSIELDREEGRPHHRLDVKKVGRKEKWVKII